MPMDASHYMSNIVNHREIPAASRPTPSRSQSNVNQAESINEIDFGIPDVRPGLAKIGRRLTEMSGNLLYDEPRSSSESKRASTSSRTSLDLAAKVPFMGDEPVFCPFCNKPLPPALLLQHMSAAEDQPDKGGRDGIKPVANPRIAGVGESAGMAKTASAPEGSTKLAAGTAIKPELHKTPSGLSTSRPVSPTTSAQLEKPLKEADGVDLAASKVAVDTETLRKWARIAGIQLDLPGLQTEKQSSSHGPEPQAMSAKPFPKIAPPPEDQSRSSSRNSSRFSLFGKAKSKQFEDDEDSDDDMGGASGYARLDAPASPEREERNLPTLSRRSTERPVNGNEDSAGVKEADRVIEPPPASEEEVRLLLKEVLTKVNEMSKSHASVLHSHSALLTTLKIARSNLAMAEANAEMLEEQLKRQPPAPKPAPPVSTPRTPVSNSMGPPPAPAPASKPMPTRTATTGPGAGEGSLVKTEPNAPRRSAETTRPQSIVIPQSTNPRTPMSASSDSSKGMFGSFWNRNKDKVGEFMNSLPDLTPMAEKSSFDFARSPTSPAAVPYGAALPDQYRSPGLNRSKTVHGRAGESDGLPRASSYTNVQAASSASTAAPAVPTDPYTRELTRLRQLYQSSQTKMESMTKELADLKKGKIEMEAELENLSQALFEEANKMVAEERKKRAELEESLKEVKEEREALRETIKVLGGQVEDQSDSSRGDPDEDQDDLGDLPEFQPRDLDKHYEALRKSIHHVADGAGGEQWAQPVSAQGGPKTPDEPRGGELESSSEVFKTPSQPRRHSLPDISSPEPQRAPALHDPWADSEPASSFNDTIQMSPSRARRQIKPLTTSEDIGPKDFGQAPDPSGRDENPESPSLSTKTTEPADPVSPKAEKLDALDKMMEKMQADVVLDSPLKEKPNPFS